MEKEILIRAQNLCKTYSTGSEQFHAIKNMNVDIYKGDFTVIMGNSGSGKSTLLYLLSGLDALTAGEVYFQGEKLDTFSERKLATFRSQQVGYIYQSSNLIPDMTLLENIALPGFIAKKNKKEVIQKAEQLLSLMGLEKQRNRLPSQTSGGQQQRAAIARALVNNPEVLFADEPTGSLNFDQGVAVLDTLTNLNRNGQSIVMITHDMKAACRANRLIIIQDGKIDGILNFEKYDHTNIQEREHIIFSYVAGKE
ncbi:ABC transporter ATP-binding protein [Lysinibacillus boronitolerans]|uniref:ABC transporter ATP-binding protein n=1 Tax=Lysinibacillus boronitolerans JCM 21713 = 10a = NBRC 103108 TaxID=1294264 RepID=A0ABR4XV60_9BACI|nr:ABC transporter ATP-binding protein [Lysinibacillus boronitolerans]KGR81194.1 ABC transporter ATP-binding protein [Lysinibacillus boronitolerans JCM 21713 = 10a = NBRC 103108]